ncbi:MAG: hypothetical protein ACRDLY_05965, partial [Thermoleophilaceae bacterium]
AQPPREEPATVQLPRGGGPPPPGGAPAGRPAKTSIPPGGIQLPPTGPGSHMRRSLPPRWAQRLLVPLALVLFLAILILLIAWAV